MQIHFEITKETKKNLIKAIEQEVGQKAKYLGAPSFAYQIGDYTLAKDGSLSWDDTLHGDPKEFEHSAAVIDACVNAGFEPTEWADLEEYDIEDLANPEEDSFTVWVKDLSPNAVENLKRTVEAKHELFKRVFGGNITIIEGRDSEGHGRVGFPWFSSPKSYDEMEAYSHFIDSLCNMARIQKRVSIKQHPVENEKYEFRCFLLRLGFIGKEYKEDRKILLGNLEGSAAFKRGCKA